MSTDIVNDPINKWGIETGYKTREEAINAAIDSSEPNDRVAVHQEGCGMVHDLDCDCKPEIIVVPARRVQ